MVTIDELLTRYVDSLNSGTPINVDDLLKMCPETEQQELKQLCDMAKAYKNSSPFIKSDQRKEEYLFSHLEKIRFERQKKTYQLTGSDLDKVAEEVEKYSSKVRDVSDNEPKTK